MSCIIRAVKKNKMMLASKLIDSCKTIECLRDYEEDIDLCEVYGFVDCKEGIINICEKIINNEVIADMINKRILTEECGTLISIPMEIREIIVTM